MENIWSGFIYRCEQCQVLLKIVTDILVLGTRGLTEVNTLSEKEEITSALKKIGAINEDSKPINGIEEDREHFKGIATEIIEKLVDFDKIYHEFKSKSGITAIQIEKLSEDDKNQLSKALDKELTEIVRAGSSFRNLSERMIIEVAKKELRKRR